MLRDLLRGANALRRGFMLLRTVRSLRRLAIVPFLVNVILFGAGIPLAIWLTTSWVGDLLPDVGWLSGLLRTIIQILVGLVIIIGSLFLFSTIGGIVSAPFNGPLAEGIERYQREQSGAINRETKRDSTAGCIGGVVTATGRLGIFLVFYPPILALQLIPVIGTVLSPIFAFLYGAFVLSFDFTDPIFEHHGLLFRERIRFIMRRKALYLGFGGGAVVMMLVPVANLLLMPVCVAGGTLLFLDEIERSDTEGNVSV